MDANRNGREYEKGKEKTSADYADYADFLRGFLRGKAKRRNSHGWTGWEFDENREWGRMNANKK